ncbi:MAG: VWA domain-containing protein [Synergistaceae bacterium]|jgi:Ca-activated chloride channel family protein|nr:VWA domain-containing protein [Synergistaceae bacterium]
MSRKSISRKVEGTSIVLLAVAVLLFGSAGSLFAETPAVVLEVGADTPVVMARSESDSEKTSIVTVRALLRPEKKGSRSRPPLAVAVVIDKSGSMGSGGKMRNAKLGALEALRLLDERDRAALVIYDSSARVLVPARPAGDMRRFERALSRVQADGNTALWSGVSLGIEEIVSLTEDGYVPRIVLLSDGLANVGPSSPRDLARLGRSAAEQEVTITTIGLGLDYDEDLMTALASESGGNAYFAKDPASLADIFKRDMKDAVALTGRRLKVTFSCEGGTKPVRLVGRSGRTSGAIIETEIENLYGNEKYALFELEIPKGEDGTRFRAGTMSVEYIDAASGAPITLKAPLEIACTAKMEEVAQKRDSDIASQVEMAKNAEIRDEAVRLADAGQAQAAADLLRERSQYLSEMAPTAAAPEAMREEISDFEGMALYMTENGTMSNEQRKATRNKAYRTKNQQSGEDD